MWIHLFFGHLKSAFSFLAWFGYHRTLFCTCCCAVQTWINSLWISHSPLLTTMCLSLTSIRWASTICLIPSGKKKNNKPTKPRAAQLYFHVLTRNQFHTEQGVMSHEPQVGAHILAVLPPAVLGVQLPLQLCTSACQERAPTPLCREQSEDEWDGCTGGARRQKDLGSWQGNGPQLLPSQLLESNAGLQTIWHAVTSNAEAGKDRCVCWQQLPASKKGGSGWGHAGTHERAVVEPGVGSFRDFSLPSFASTDKLFCKSLKLRSGFLLCLKPLASSTPVLDDTRAPGLSSQGCTELSEKAREEQLDDPSQQWCNSHWGKAEQSSFKALLTHRAQRLGWGCSSPLRQQKHLSLTLLLLSV